jgi:hypothetical protein
MAIYLSLLDCSTATVDRQTSTDRQKHGQQWRRRQTRRRGARTDKSGGQPDGRADRPTAWPRTSDPGQHGLQHLRAGAPDDDAHQVLLLHAAKVLSEQRPQLLLLGPHVLLQVRAHRRARAVQLRRQRAQLRDVRQLADAREQLRARGRQKNAMSPDGGQPQRKQLLRVGNCKPRREGKGPKGGGGLQVHGVQVHLRCGEAAGEGRLRRVCGHGLVVHHPGSPGGWGKGRGMRSMGVGKGKWNNEVHGGGEREVE